MNFLHAYWRMDYIEASKKSGEPRGNPFLEIPKATDDRSVRLLHRGIHSYVVMNIYPYNPGHLMAIPYREVSDFKALSKEELADLWDSVIKAQLILEKGMNPDGFNVGANLGSAAGAGIPQHLHIHIVPRWNGDTNFLPVISQTKSLPQALDQLWDRLRPFAEALKAL
jgi:ATP adenylyltransferase